MSGLSLRFLISVIAKISGFSRVPSRKWRSDLVECIDCAELVPRGGMRNSWNVLFPWFSLRLTCANPAPRARIWVEYPICLHPPLASHLEDVVSPPDQNRVQ